MSEKNAKELVNIELIEKTGGLAQLLGSLEHQLDLALKLAVDLSKLIDQDTIPNDVKERLEVADRLLTHQSLNFENLNNPIDNSKLDTAIERKSLLRNVQSLYFNKLIEEQK